MTESLPPPSSTPLSTPAASRPARRSGSGLLWLLLLAVLGAGGWFWYDGQQRTRQARAAADDVAQRLQALESRIDGLRRDVGSHSQRLQQADATNRVLRDELLGIGQRAVILEDQVAKLADANRHGTQSLRLDETELLLTLGQQRLVLSSDLDGARRAYALAAGVLDGVDHPGMLNLRQTLTQERTDLDALKTDPRQAALSQLNAFARALPNSAALPMAVANRSEESWWQRMLSRFVKVGSADPALAVSSEQRNAGQLALELELTMARAAIERGDLPGFHAALGRADAWLRRLWPESTQRRALQTQLQNLQTLPLRLELPTLGSTLKQLQAQRGG